MTEQRPEPLCFNSRSKEPNDKFSNFYEVKLEMAEGCFNSVEHYFQAMKFIDENHSRFEVEGDLGRQGITSGNWKQTVSKGRFIKSAGSKSGTTKYKLTVRSDGLDRERAKRKMKDGLRKKFENEPLRSLLLETLQRPLVHTPMRGKSDYWTARVDKTSGDIVGDNNMGKLLMEVRKELQERTKSIQGKENEDKDGTKGTKSKESEDDITNEDDVSQEGDTEGHQAKKRKRKDSGEHSGVKVEVERDKTDEQKQSEKPVKKRKKTEKKSEGDTKGHQAKKRKHNHKDGGEHSGVEAERDKTDEQKQSEKPVKKRKKTEKKSERDTKGHQAKKRKHNHKDGGEHSGVEVERDKTDEQKQSEEPVKKRKKTEKKSEDDKPKMA